VHVDLGVCEMDPSDAYYKTKRNLLLFVGCLLLSIFAGFKISSGEQKITVLPFQLERPEFLTTILLVAVVFNLFQFSLQWAAQKAEIQQNRFHRIDFVSTTSIAGLSIICYFGWLVSPLITFEKKLTLGDILGSLVAVVISIAGSLVASKGSESVGRWLKRRAVSEEEELARILKSQMWVLIFNPDSQRAKKITFEADRGIGTGRNNNEDTWRIKNGLLEILNNEKKVFSRFTYDKAQNSFVHTNDEDTLSIRSQRIVPTEGWSGVLHETVYRPRS
jgi:hypothetical protein